jgi:hypothetical protein
LPALNCAGSRFVRSSCIPYGSGRFRFRGLGETSLRELSEQGRAPGQSYDGGGVLPVRSLRSRLVNGGTSKATAALRSPAVPLLGDRTWKPSVLPSISECRLPHFGYASPAGYGACTYTDLTRTASPPCGMRSRARGRLANSQRSPKVWSLTLRPTAIFSFQTAPALVASRVRVACARPTCDSRAARWRPCCDVVCDETQLLARLANWKMISSQTVSGPQLPIIPWRVVTRCSGLIGFTR